MKIQVDTDRFVESTDELVQMVEDVVQAALGRYDDRLTRIEVHLSDDNGDKDGRPGDKRCLIEARPAGMKPVVVTSEGDSLEQVCHDAARKMQSRLQSDFGRIAERDGKATIRHAEGP